MQQEYIFLKNIYSGDYVKNTDNLKNLEDFYSFYEYFLQVVTLLKNENFKCSLGNFLRFIAQTAMMLKI